MEGGKKDVASEKAAPPKRSGKDATTLRVAIVGCGAIARSFHVPALTSIPGIRERIVLIDRSLGRAQALREDIGAGHVGTDHRKFLGEVDAAVVAVPPEYHLEVTADFLEAGVPVLCEKPLAPSFEDASALVEMSRSAGVRVGVNQIRRFFPAVRAARDWIRSRGAGGLRRIEIYDGAPFEWPLASGTAFGLGGTGRGVLQDLGAHVLDMVCWWTGSEPEVTRYMDDAMGGSEAVARVEFQGDGFSGVVQMSWLSRLSNAFRVEAEDGVLEGEIRAWDSVRLTRPGQGPRRVPLEPEVPSFLDVKKHVTADFLEAAAVGREFAVPASEALPSIRMIDRCYSSRRRFAMPWHDLPAEVCRDLA